MLALSKDKNRLAIYKFLRIDRYSRRVVLIAKEIKIPSDTNTKASDDRVKMRIDLRRSNMAYKRKIMITTFK